MTQETKQPQPLLSICGGDKYEELHRGLHGAQMHCRDPNQFMQDLASLLTSQKDFGSELAHFVYAVGSGDYVDHHRYTRPGVDMHDFSKTLNANLALDARNTAIYLYNRLRDGGYYTQDGSFPYALHQFSDRALSFRPIY